MYRIKYNYDTGDSFSNEYGLEDFIETEFESSALANRNARNIQEHYKMYKELNGWGKRGSNQDIIEKYASKEWFVSKKVLTVDYGSTYQVIDPKDRKKYEDEGLTIREQYNDFDVQYRIKLFLENQKEIEYYCSWCGYFENLNYVEVVTESQKYYTK